MIDGDKWSNQPIEKVLSPKKLKCLISDKFKILDYDSIIFNFGDLGYFKIINSRYIIGIINRLRHLPIISLNNPYQIHSYRHPLI